MRSNSFKVLWNGEMKYLEHYCDAEDCQWLDSRLYSPSPNSAGVFEVVRLCKTLDTPGTGFGTWRPENAYTEGKWVEFTPNFASQMGIIENGQVLFWRQNVLFDENIPKYKYIKEFKLKDKE